MIDEKVVLRKRRDFSDVLNATFAFIRQEYKTFGYMLLVYAGGPVLIQGILSAMYVDTTLTDLFNNIGNPQQSQNFVNEMPGKALLLNVINLIIQTFLTGLTYCYIALYKEKGAGNFEINEVWNKFTGLFLTFIGYSMLTGIVIVLGFMALLIPGIYVIVPLSLILIIKVIEGQGYGDSFSRSFNLIKNHWWETFGLLVIGMVIVGVISSIFNIPALAIGITKGLLQDEFNISALPMIVTTLVSTLGAALVTPLSPIIMSFQYFSLVEHKDNLSLMDKIDKINEQPEHKDE